MAAMVTGERMASGVWRCSIHVVLSRRAAASIRVHHAIRVAGRYRDRELPIDGMQPLSVVIDAEREAQGLECRERPPVLKERDARLWPAAYLEDDRIGVDRSQVELLAW